VTQPDQKVSEPLREEEDRGVVADMTISPQRILARRHIVVQARPLPKNIEKSGRDELKGEINKIKPPTFDGEHKKEEDVETWLLGMKKYFQLQNYSTHVKGRIAMYQLKGKASMWWDQLV
jgi:hypothetical protein